MDISYKHTSRLGELKDMVETSWEYFNHNSKRFNEFMRFVFDTSLSNADKTKLGTLNKPTLEFNVLESIINNRRGEFSMHQPTISVHASDGVPLERFTPDYLKMIEVLESYLRNMISGPDKDNLGNKIMIDTLGGGYSVVEIFTDYINELSFDQQITCRRVFDPTLTGFDPLARESHKGDGRYAFQLFPISKKEFIDTFGKEHIQDMKFSRGIGSFNWSYENKQQDIVVICELFEKVQKKTKIVKLSNGHVVVKKHYDELLVEWEKRGFIEQPPIIIEERMTHLEHIERYRFCETAVLKHDETDYKFLPLIFIDGNSVDIKNADTNAACQMTRPYVYHAKGIQQLKNFSGQTVGAEIENLVQHKFIVSVEAIPDDYQEAYKNVQQADVLMYNSFYKGDTNVPLAPPREVQRTPTPPLVESTFLGSDRVTQAILGNYDSTLGANEKNISGVAIANGAIHTNAASTPYLINYIEGLNRIAQVALDLIPKYYVTPRTLPIRKADGKRDYQVINNPQDQSSVSIHYQPHELNVTVQAGVNSSIAKQVALDQIIKMMQVSPLFAQFINTQGLEILLDNLDIRGIDIMKAQSVQFMEMMKKQQAEAAGKPSPEAEAMKLQAEALKTEADAAIGRVQVQAAEVKMKKEQNDQEMALQATKLAIEKQKVDAQVMEIISDIQMKGAKLEIEQERVDSENARTAVETVIELAKNHTEVTSKE